MTAEIAKYTAAAWEMFGVRLWHPEDQARLSADLWESMKRSIDAERRKEKARG